MHPALRKGPLFYQKKDIFTFFTPHFPLFFTKKTSPFSTFFTKTKHFYFFTPPFSTFLQRKHPIFHFFTKKHPPPLHFISCLRAWPSRPYTDHATCDVCRKRPPRLRTACEWCSPPSNGPVLFVVPAERLANDADNDKNAVLRIADSEWSGHGVVV